MTSDTFVLLSSPIRTFRKLCFYHEEHGGTASNQSRSLETYSIIHWYRQAFLIGQIENKIFRLHLIMETDPFSETLCLKKLTAMYSAKNNDHVYSNIPSAGTFPYTKRTNSSCPDTWITM
jgi:hypothetical protein